MFGLGIGELLVILIIILVLFGGKKLPELSRSLGEAVRELRKSLSGDLDDNSKNKKTKKSSE